MSKSLIISVSGQAHVCCGLAGRCSTDLLSSIMLRLDCNFLQEMCLEEISFCRREFVGASRHRSRVRAATRRHFPAGLRFRVVQPKDGRSQRFRVLEDQPVNGVRHGSSGRERFGIQSHWRLVCQDSEGAKLPARPLPEAVSLVWPPTGDAGAWSAIQTPA